MKVAIILKSPTFSGEVDEQKVIYADAGYKHKDKVGEKEIVAVVGDFDSLGKAPKGEKILSLEVEKNFTDGERAVRLAHELGYSEVVIYGAYGGKIEHVLGNLTLLKIAENLGLKARIKDNDRVTELIEKNVVIKTVKGSSLSLIPYGGNCSFSDSKGLYYSLKNITLTPQDTVGISNVAIESTVQIDFTSGQALIIYQEK